MKRIRIMLLAVITILALSTCAYAESASSYSADKALNYAENHWDDGKGDCVVFARACLEAGGIPRDASKESYSVDGYLDYLVDNGYATEPKELVTEQKFGKEVYYVSEWDNLATDLAPGDLILYKCSKANCPTPYFHFSICAAPSSDEYVGYYRCYAHNSPINYKPICKIKHVKCGAEISDNELYAVHITSSDNGFGTYNDKVSISTKLSAYNKVKVSWTDNGADGYNVFMAVNQAGAYKKVGYSTGSSCTVTIPSADVGKTRYFMVRPCKDIDGSGYEYVGAASNKVSCATLSKSSVTSVAKKSKSSVTVKYSNAKNETGYQISKSKSKTGTSIVATIKTTSKFTKEIKAKRGVTYYYKVRSYKTVGSSKVYSPWSTAKKYRIK